MWDCVLKLIDCYYSGMCLGDRTLWSYVIAMFMNLYGSVLFVWWWRRAGSASSVYMIVTLLFVGQFIENLYSVYAGAMYWTEGIEYYRALTIESPAWPLRKIVSNFSLAYLALHMTIRALSSRRVGNNESRRMTD